MIALRIDDLEVRLGGRQVLDIPELTIEGPGVVVVVGPNGAGKSTLLRIIAGLARPSRGMVTVHDDGAVIGGPLDRAVRARCGYVPDHPVLFEDMTVADNMWYIAWSAGRRDMPDDALDLITDLRFGDLLDRFPHQLSRGQHQMASLLMATARSVDCLLLDEPTLALDKRNRRVLSAALAARGRESLVVVASHEDDIVGGADRIVHLEEGRVTPAESNDEISNDEISNGEMNDENQA